MASLVAQTDQNPIENVWAVMVRELSEELRAPARQLNADQLSAAIARKWEEMRRRPHYLASLAASIQTRLEECVEAAGAHTGYQVAAAAGSCRCISEIRATTGHALV